ncbi:MAG: phosphate--AMP phosphotransferase [Chitinivibrionales bacterium]|nr:phosphate--AMP phosphotransferase [Chitinivibrionales bacterium]MBD3396762.1 phosphate--AMP phosphotransferase [Chitinivibrionales bacterium]
MLREIDLSRKITKDEYKKVMTDLELKLGTLQRRALGLGIPVVIVFEGWDAAGKGTQINKLLLSLDPRGFTVHPINAPNEEERLRPFLWRFWTKTPARGTIAIFDRSWYGRVLVGRVDKIVPKKIWSKAYDEIVSFERQLADDGNAILKFFLHISPKEQKKRFRKLAANRSTAWKVTKEDWKHHKQYDKYLAATEDALARTDTAFAPWTIVEAHDWRFATVKVFTAVADALERACAAAERAQRSSRKRKAPARRDDSASSILDGIDLAGAITKDEYVSSLKKYQRRMMELEHEVYLKRLPVIIVYEGSDAGGKGGNIKRLVQGMDPRGYQVIPIAAPNDIEKAHSYLWRFWMHIPKAGHIAIFDRSWYGRTLVERVEGFCSEEEWRRAYREINEMEAQLVGFGTVLVKFWLHIDQDTQLERFKARQRNPHKRWKITDEDWRNREKWDAYKLAIDEMLYRTSTPLAPWTVVEANCKWYARIKALKTVVQAIEKKL